MVQYKPPNSHLEALECIPPEIFCILISIHTHTHTQTHTHMHIHPMEVFLNEPNKTLEEIVVNFAFEAYVHV